MPRTAKKRLSARERGYVPRSEAAASLRSLANRLEMEQREGATSLVKMTLNMWFTPEDEPQNALAQKESE